jgi:uncharacterized membrane protein
LSSPQEQDAFTLIEQNLTREKFNVTEDVRIGPLSIRIMGTSVGLHSRMAARMWTFVMVTELKTQTVDEISRISSLCMEYAAKNRGSSVPLGPGAGMFVITLMVSDSYDPEFLRAFSRKTPKRHWGAMEFPVLYAAGSKDTYF